MYSTETESFISKEFPTLKDTCYLDHTGATLYAKSQISSVANNLSENIYGNPHALNLSSRYSTDVIDQVRYRILSQFHTNPGEYTVVYTSGATAALKLVAECFDWKGECYNNSQVEDASSVPPEHPEERTEPLIHAESGSCFLREHVNSDKTEVQGRAGSFVYLQDNHTSVLGMREIAAEKGACIHCMTHDSAFATFEKNETTHLSDCTPVTNSLFVYPAQCNFSGVKYPLSWINQVQAGAVHSAEHSCSCNSKWFCYLDAASFVSTNDLDLSIHKPDFVCISFYKIFGYPTGIGALLVRNTSSHALRKSYFGGGTVQISLSAERYHVPRQNLSEKFEDGTIPFLSIISLQHGFDVLKKLTGNMVNISLHTLFLARYVHHSLLLMHHRNGAPAVVLYSDTDYEDFSTQGNIVNFNLLRANGEYIGFAEVLHMANLHNIHLRTGCFCNPGACQRHLNLTTNDLRHHFQAGHVCGDEVDLVEGRPTGSVRISFGYMSTKQDADKFLEMITTCFIEGEVTMKIPLWWPIFRRKYRQKFGMKVLKNGVALPNMDPFSENNAELSSNIPKTEGKIMMKTDELNEAERSLKLIIRTDETLNLKLEHSLLDDSPAKSVSFGGKSLQLHLSQINLYPIKSCGSVTVQEWQIGPRGLLYDREWMIVTPSGVSLTQKQEPKLCLIKPTINLQEGSLYLSFKGLDPVQLPLALPSVSDSSSAALCCSKVCGDQVQGWDCGDAVAEWLSEALGRPGLRLLRQSSVGGRLQRPMRSQPAAGSGPELSLSNQAQFLLVNAASVAWLDQQLQERLPTATDSDSDSALHSHQANILDRFRCNFTVEGVAAFEENSWSQLQIGTVGFMVSVSCSLCAAGCLLLAANMHPQVEGPCTRCQMICIDQSTGERAREPLQALSAALQGKLRFGVYLNLQPHHPEGSLHTVAINDSITVTIRNKTC